MNSSFSRRGFLKTGVAAGVAASVPTIFVPKAFGAYEPGQMIHPKLDGKLVVGITDPKMVDGHQPVTTWAQQEQMVKTEAVWNNMDKMACRLTGEKSPEKAWRTIFVLPRGKSAKETVVAIKTNSISNQHPRSAVMSKVCRALVNELGIKPENIHIYDACHGGKIDQATPFANLPEGVKIENKWGGSNTDTEVPLPWNGGKSKCLSHLADGTVDILVNVAVCKGHSPNFGQFTMTMKNHFGTFSPRPGHGKQPLEYLIGINRSEAILGKTDPKTGAVIHPRQQLCIVDALWSSKQGPFGNPTDQTAFLAMGPLGPVVDYQVATAFRKGRMGWPVNETAAERFLQEFGISKSDLANGGIPVEIQ